MKKLFVIVTALVMSLLGSGSATATDLYPWNNPAAPYRFLFGNEVDTHQQLTNGCPPTVDTLTNDD